MLKQYSDKIPEYYPTMYLDGYSPDQIRFALHRKMTEDAEAAEEEEEQSGLEMPQFIFSSEVKINK